MSQDDGLLGENKMKVVKSKSIAQQEVVLLYVFDNANETVKPNSEIKCFYAGVKCRPKVKLKRRVLMFFLLLGLVERNR